MTPEYKPSQLESRWQSLWQKENVYSADHNRDGPPAYIVDMFPYPSGDSMHVGHPRGYVATDVYSRVKRMQGYRVLHPMGWDAFGLPAEETAIANQEYPSITVERNIEKFKSQLVRLGLGYDWSREVNTTSPDYYKHTQTIFLEIFKRGLAYYKTSTVNWCPELGTVLANEDVVDGLSERGEHPVLQQPMRQWTLGITQYASRLVDDLELLPQWPDKVKNAQRSWIGKSSGHEFSFATSVNIEIPVYTTKLETLMGVTFIALSPDSELAKRILTSAQNKDEIAAYIEESKRRSDRERLISKEKSGVRVHGVHAQHPITRESIPIIVADYVLSGVGSGAVMGVPAHDERDADTANLFNFPIVEVVTDTYLKNSGELTGLSIKEAREKIVDETGAVSVTRFKMRDWIFSRQRFWGEPFPIVWVEGLSAYEKLKAGNTKEWLPDQAVSYAHNGLDYFAVPVLPEYLSAVQLPIVDSYKHTGEPSGPLAAIDSWVHAFICPDTGRISSYAEEGMIPCQRETNTMPQWAGSSWYWLRYMDPANKDLPFSPESAEEWGPVTVYAGADHAVAHLIYARFWHKVLFDCGYVSFPEPFMRLEFLGYVLAADGSKISKRKGNSRNPDDVIDDVGADSFRLYELAIGPFEKAVPWIDDNLQGQKRFLDRLWRFCKKVLEANVAESSPEIEYYLNSCIKKVTNDVELFKFNTAVSSLMIFVNEAEKLDLSTLDLGRFVQVLAPFAPHFSEEIWCELGQSFSVHHTSWPSVNHSALVRDTVLIPIQINGKKRSEISVSVDASEETVKQLVLDDKHVIAWIEGKEVKRFIYVPQQIVNLVI